MYKEKSILSLVMLAFVTLLASISCNARTSTDSMNILIISIANTSGHHCELISLNDHECKVIQNAMPQLIPNMSEKNFWIGDHTYGFYSRKNENTLKYKCGPDTFTIHTVQEGHCNSKPYGDITASNLQQVEIQYDAIAGKCSEELPGYIMWRIKPKKSIPTPYVGDTDATDLVQ
ncbi:MAG: hypothetical protein VX737_03630 [Pseudomonadota bacterium]|nr:hypothetical protein [Pseudomonadota bacterium]